MEGKGTFTYSNGDLYIGAFKASKRDGQGSYYFKEHGCIMFGEWKEGGFMHGKWVHADGTTFYGNFKGITESGSIDPSQGAYYFARSGLLQPGAFDKAGGWRGGAPPAVGEATALVEVAGVKAPVREKEGPKFLAGHLGTVDTLAATASQLNLSKLSVTELEQLCLKLFQSADADGNGHLDVREFRAVLRSAELGLTKSMIREVLSAADENDDGVISYVEFLPVMMDILSALQAAGEADAKVAQAAAATALLFNGMSLEQLTAVLAGVFKAADTDGNGTLSRAEFRDALLASNLGFTRKNINLLMAEADANRDGRISYAEFVPVGAALLFEAVASELLAGSGEAVSSRAAKRIQQRLKAADPQDAGTVPYDTLVAVVEEVSYDMLGLSALQVMALCARAPRVQGGSGGGAAVDYRKFLALAEPMMASMKASIGKSQQLDKVRELVTPGDLRGLLDPGFDLPALQAALTAEVAKLEDESAPGWFAADALAALFSRLDDAVPGLVVPFAVKDVLRSALGMRGVVKAGMVSATKLSTILGHAYDAVRMMQSEDYLEKKAEYAAAATASST